MTGRRRPVRERFYDMFAPEPNTGCWLWTGALLKSGGYGALTVNRSTVRAHRLSWELHRGTIPSGLFVCHKCDTPSCVNPDHLFLGTNLENMHDRDAKNRVSRDHMRGEKNPNTRLTSDQVRAMRKERASGRSTADIAKRFGVCWGSADDVVRGRSWSHV